MCPFQLNPEHTVPTIVDNGKNLWDSHAIACYLIDKYAKNDDLYPRDLYLRAKCNQHLFFDASVLFNQFLDCSRHIFRGGDEIPKQFIENINASFDTLEATIGEDQYLVGHQMTVADISTMAIVTVIDEIYAPLDETRHRRILKWLKRMKSMDFYEEMNAKPILRYKEFLMGRMKVNNKNKSI